MEIKNNIYFFKLPPLKYVFPGIGISWKRHGFVATQKDQTWNLIFGILILLTCLSTPRTLYTYNILAKYENNSCVKCLD